MRVQHVVLHDDTRGAAGFQYRRTAGPPITTFIGNHYMEGGTECGTFLETASPDGEEEGIGETSRLRRGVRKLLGRGTEPRVLREEGQDADDGAYWEEEDEGGEWNDEDGSRHLIRGEDDRLDGDTYVGSSKVPLLRVDDYEDSIRESCSDVGEEEDDDDQDTDDADTDEDDSDDSDDSDDTDKDETDYETIPLLGGLITIKFKNRAEEVIELARTISSCSTCAPIENIATALMVSCHVGLAVGLGRCSMGIGTSRGLLDLEV